MTNPEVRRCRFVQWQPCAISICSLPALGANKAVIVRENFGMELVETGVGMKSLGHFIGTGSKSVEGVSWAKCAQDSTDRLFSVGLDGLVTEWDLERFIARRQTDTNGGGPAWCCSASPSSRSLAVGCENGSIRFYDLLTVKEDKQVLRWNRNMQVQQAGRILSLAWSPCGRFLACGTGISSISILDVEANKTLHVLKLESTTVRDKKGDREKKETLVWSLAFSTELLWSADSCGKVTSWCLQTGTMVQSFQLSPSDIFNLVIHPSRPSIYAAGADQRLYELKLTESTGNWFVAGHTRAHSNDIRSLALLNESVLLSGSVDTTVAEYQINDLKKTAKKILPHGIDCVKIVGSIMWASEGSSIRAWDASGPVQIPPRQLLNLQFGKEQILSFNVSSSAITCRMANGQIKAYRYKFVSEAGSVVEVTLEDAKLGLDNVCAMRLVDSTILFIRVKPKMDCSLLSCDLLSGEVKEICELPFKSCKAIEMVDNHIICLASGSSNQLVICTSLNGKSSQKICDLPTCINRIQPIEHDGSNIILVGDKALYLFSLTEGRLIDWPKSIKSDLQSTLDHLPGPILGSSHNSGKLFIHGTDFVITMPTEQQQQSANAEEGSLKVRRSTRKSASRSSVAQGQEEEDGVDASRTIVQGCIKSSRVFNGVLYAGLLPDSSILVVERHWDDIAAGFPPVVKRKLFGGYN